MRTEWRLLRLVLPYRALFLLAMVSGLGASLLDGASIVLLIPLLKVLFGTAGALAGGGSQLEGFIDWLLGPLLASASGPAQAAAWLVGLLVAVLLVQNTLSYATSQLQVALQEGLVRDLRVRLFGHMLRLDLGYFQRQRAGHMISGMLTEVDQTKGAITAALARLFQNAAMIVVTLVIMSQLSLRLTLVTLSAAPILVLGMQLLLRRLRRHSRARAVERGEITSTIAERLGAVKLIRAYGEQDRETARFADQADRYRKKVIRTQRFSSLTGPVSEVFGGMLVILIVVAATQPVIVGGTGLGAASIIGFLVAALKLMSPIKAISQYPAVMAVALASAERVFEILDAPETDQDLPGEEPAHFTREIVFDRVGFAYPGDPPVLHEVSLTVPKGRVVAIVGPSGAGKTTLVDLLPRFHDVTSGQVLLDGVPLTRLRRSSLRRLIGVVSQETVLLNDTVHGNIAFGTPGATRAQVADAARAANAAEFIAQLPQGYETELGEAGTRLSGGQRQRIAIARALLRDPPILILDEATSALDSESERLVQQAIERLLTDRTVFVIAHRLATVRHADEIVVLEAGRIVERGGHDALYRGGGLYRRLYDLQFRDEGAPTAGAPGA